MPSDTANLILKNLVIEPRLELSLTCRRGRDIHGCLATTQNHKILTPREATAIEWRVRGIRLEHREVSSRDELGRLVLASGNKVGAVLVPLQVRDGHVEVVDGKVGNQIARLFRVKSAWVIHSLRRSRAMVVWGWRV